MIVSHLLLGERTIAKASAIPGDIVVVTPGEELLRYFEAILEKQLVRKTDALDDLHALAGKFKSLHPGEDYHKRVDSTVDRIHELLSQGMSLNYRDNSLTSYLKAMLVYLSGEALGVIIGADGVVDGREVIVCESNNGVPVVDWKLTGARISALCGGGRLVIAGSFGRKVTGETVDLGKHGSELTANMAGAVLGAEAVCFLVPDLPPQEVDNITYEEAAQLFSGGYPVYPPAMQPSRKAGIPIRICRMGGNTKTVLTIGAPSGNASKGITGVVASGPMTLFTIYGTGLLGSIGISSAIFGALAGKGLNIHFISQSLSEYSISFAVMRDASEAASAALDSILGIARANFGDLSFDFREVRIVSVFGQGMKNVPGISAKVYTALGNAGINVVASSQGGEELCISVVVDDADAAAARAALITLK